MHDGVKLRSKQVVIAAGAWSGRIQGCGAEDLPLDTERGYHIVFSGHRHLVTRPVAWVEGGFYAVPANHGLRLAGTVELASANAAPNFSRADNLLRAARQTFPRLNEEGSTQWMGCRPSMPDSLPVIGRSPVHRTVFFAFGHGHLGLTGAATTGKIIADLIAERSTDFDIAPFRADRFA